VAKIPILIKPDETLITRVNENFEVFNPAVSSFAAKQGMPFEDD
jgi:hypothetical protein